MNTKSRNRYTQDFKTQALALVDAGKPVAEVAEELCLSTDLIYRWRRVRRSDNAELRAEGKLSGADDLPALRRENTRLRIENDILKKAALILATQSPHSATK